MQLSCLATLFLLMVAFRPNFTPFSLAILLPSCVLSTTGLVQIEQRLPTRWWWASLRLLQCWCCLAVRRNEYLSPWIRQAVWVYFAKSVRDGLAYRLWGRPPAWCDEWQAVILFLAASYASGQLFREDLFTSCGFQRLNLHVEILLCGWNTCITDFHKCLIL